MPEDKDTVKMTNEEANEILEMLNAARAQWSYEFMLRNDPTLNAILNRCQTAINALTKKLGT